MIAPRLLHSEAPENQTSAASGATSASLRMRASLPGTTTWIGWPLGPSWYEGAENRRCQTTRFGTKGGTVSLLCQTPRAPRVLPEKPSHLDPNQLSILTSTISGGE